MIGLRRQEEAFDPASPQKVLFLDDRLFALRRGEKEAVLVLVNVSSKPVTAKIGDRGHSLFTGETAEGQVTLQPYGFDWIRVE